MDRINELLVLLKKYVVQNKDEAQLEINKGDLRHPAQPLTIQAAATKIQTRWRQSKIKQAMEQNPYITYLSLRNCDDDEQFLSASMFGKHVAEHRPTSKYRLNNPYIRSNANYHRFDGFFDELFEKLLIEFNIDSAIQEGYHTFIPIVRLKNTPISDVCPHFIGNKKFKILEKQGFTVSILVLFDQPRHNKKTFYTLTASGLVASPWEIVTNIRHKDKIRFIMKQIKLHHYLPQTPDALLTSDIYTQLTVTARTNCPTQKLATCLQRILKNLPKHIQPKAVQSIACVTDIANTFYTYNYPKYAFTVYIAIHEISLALLKYQAHVNWGQEFGAFVAESRHTLDQALALNSTQIDIMTFLACPAASGTNAYFLALKLALTMRTFSGKRPLVHVIKPSYFEFAFITPATYRSDADIYVLSAGPIVDPQGLTPGVDINQFITRYILSTKRQKPTTLIIDTTTALYKNLHLNVESQQLIHNGQLSIIMHESHQKFGMIHTDQAQYGRMFAICSNVCFDAEILSTIQKNAQEDYANHLDFRIGAYISSTCGDVLEDIKTQHFRNGALLRQVLLQIHLATQKIVKHSIMLPNLDELYFVLSSAPILDKIPERMIEIRDSFGHFNTVLEAVSTQIRLSADASDHIDCLIQATQIYVAYHFTSQDALAILMNDTKRTRHDTSISEQIMVIAIANFVLDTHPVSNMSHSFSFFLRLKDLLLQCPLLKGRASYDWIVSSYFKLRQHFITTYQIKDPQAFFRAARYLDDKGLFLKPHHLSSFTNRTWLIPFILNHHSQLSIHGCYIVLEWVTASQAQRLIENQAYYRCVEEMYITIRELLNYLKSSDNQYQQIKKHLEVYFTDCFQALDVFYSEKQCRQESKEHLLVQINKAKENYDTNRRITNKNSLKTYCSFFFSTKTYDEKLEHFHSQWQTNRGRLE